jgi:pseudouridine synthase
VYSLDKDSSGLILLTDDGRVTERLLHPRFYHEKEYEVTVRETIDAQFITKMSRGVVIGHEKTRPSVVRRINARTFRITITEGKKHQIRRMCSALSRTVETLVRLRVMNIELGTLKTGALRPLIGTEKKRLLKALDLV